VWHAFSATPPCHSGAMSFLSMSLLFRPLGVTLFTPTCAGCGQRGESLCRRCRFALAVAPKPSDRRAAFVYESLIREAVVALKYRNRRGAAHSLARLVASRLGLRRDRFDVVTWAPTSGSRVRTRGFDQAELLARGLAAELRLPCRRLLHRAHGAPQTGRSRSERLSGPAFRARQRACPVRVLLVDDVVTTGATLDSAVRALAAAGTTDVTCVVVAATPPFATAGAGGAARRAVWVA
jgi:ComF family protein